MNDNILVIFPSVFSANSISNLQSSIKKALEANNIECRDVFLDDRLIIAAVDDAVVASSVITDLFGIEKVAIASKAGNKFGDLVAAIVEVGKKIIHAGESFAVKVDSQSKEYVGRDVEFAATASIIGELSKMNIKAGNEQNCDKLIHAYATQRSAYVCIFSDKGLHGIASGSQKDQLLCSLHSKLSALSCLMIIKCGFDPRIVLLKASEEEFRESAKNIELIAKRLGKKKMQLIVANVDIAVNGSRPLVIEKVSSMILGKLCAVHNIKNIALPLSTAIFPSWFISEIVSDVAKVAIPWMPLMFMSDELYTNANALGLKDFTLGTNGIATAVYDADEYAQFVKTINFHDIVDRAMKSVKTVDLDIGPNYLHDIIDSM
jgi:hypothetical protein